MCCLTVFAPLEGVLFDRGKTLQIHTSLWKQAIYGLLTIQERGGDTESPTRRSKAADGPLTARKRLISL